ncbi:MAG: hypothetical protein R3290_07675 [Acidimicrobiia bacterium]|nr:hypothetical protein [Acidimicrobiia bacterium]
MTEFIVHVTDRPGVLAMITGQLAAAGVHIEALAAFGWGDDAQVRLLPDDAAATRRVLQEDGLAYDEREVLVTHLPHRADALAALARQLADGGVNIEALYVLRSTTEGLELAIAVDELDAARTITGP